MRALTVLMVIAAALAVMLATPASAAEVHGYRTILCRKMPYPYDEQCTEGGPHHLDLEGCRKDADYLNGLPWPKDFPSHATCEAITVDCSIATSADLQQLEFVTH